MVDKYVVRCITIYILLGGRRFFSFDASLRSFFSMALRTAALPPFSLSSSNRAWRRMSAFSAAGVSTRLT